MRDHEVTALAASLALARPGLPVRVPIQARITAIDAELAGRAAARPGEPPRSPSPDPGGNRRDGPGRRPAPRQVPGVIMPGPS